MTHTSPTTVGCSGCHEEMRMGVGTHWCPTSCVCLGAVWCESCSTRHQDRVQALAPRHETVVAAGQRLITAWLAWDEQKRRIRFAQPGEPIDPDSAQKCREALLHFRSLLQSQETHLGPRDENDVANLEGQVLLDAMTEAHHAGHFKGWSYKDMVHGPSVLPETVYDDKDPKHPITKHVCVVATRFYQGEVIELTLMATTSRGTTYRDFVPDRYR